MANNQRLNATITIGSVLQGTVGQHLNVIRSGLNRVGNEIQEVTNRQRELAQQRRILEQQGRSVDELDREYQQLGRTLDELRRRQERFERAQRAANRVGRDFGRATSEIGRFARNAAVAVGAAGAAIFSLAGSTAELGDEVAKTADNLGIGVEEFQELRYAAERSGMSISQFDSSMTAFTRRLGQAAEGTGAAVGALDQLGLSAEDLIALEPEDALGQIADRLQEIENPAERAAIAADLFSRQGIGMVNMLRDGSDGLQQLREDARATGYVLSEEAARDAEAYQDSLLDAQLTVRGLRNTIGAELMPVVGSAMDEFGTFMRSNRDDVQLFAESLAQGLRDALPVIGEIAQGIARISTRIGSATGALADFVGGWQNFGTIVGGIMASRAILAIGSLVGSVFSLGRAMLALTPTLPVVAAGFRAIGAAMIANPIGATITAIAAGAALIITNWETIEPRIRPILDAIGSAFSTVWENVIEPVIQALETAGQGIVAAWQGIRDGITAVLDAIGAAFEAVWSRISPVIDGLRWVRDRGADAIDAIGGVLNRDRGSLPEDEYTNPVDEFGGVTERAIGGAFGRGPLLVGERGPELMYPSQGGFIAHNRALERMAGLSERIRSSAAGAMRQAANVTQNITINAQGMSVEVLVEEIERRRRQAQQGALFDGASDYGQYGGAYG